MKQKKFVIAGSFFVIVCIAVFLRCWKIDSPVGDWHSFRQADTASVARYFDEKGIHILLPKYHDLSNIQSGIDNPEGYRMVEVPLYQASAVLLKKLIPSMTIEVALRIITILASVCVTLLIGVFVSHKAGWRAGLLSSLVYAILPYSIFYGRSILPDTFMTALALGSVVALDRMGHEGKNTFFWIILSVLLASLSILVKPFALCILIAALPVFISRFKWKGIFYFLLWGLIVLLPYAWWREWINQFKEGIPYAEWLFNGNGIRFKGSWFHWLFAKRIGELILGFWGLIPLGLGIMYLITEKGLWVIRMLVLGVLVYFSVVATGNIQHDYYQVMVVPVIAILCGMGIDFGLSIGRKGTISFLSKVFFLLICTVFGLMFSWFTIRTYYWINRPEIVEAGKVADELLPRNAKVIAPYGGDTAFLYQTNRSGWPVGREIEDKIARGATHYVTVSLPENDEETKRLMDEYTVLVNNERFVIIDLTEKNGSGQEIKD